MDATSLLSIRYDLHETGGSILDRIAHSGIFTDATYHGCRLCPQYSKNTYISCVFLILQRVGVPAPSCYPELKVVDLTNVLVTWSKPLFLNRMVSMMRSTWPNGFNGFDEKGE
jgi:hypothetical protein